MELPRLEPLYRKYKDQGFEVIAIDHGPDRKRAQEFIAKNKLSYSFVENGVGDAEFIYDTLQVTAFPTSFLIDGDGNVLFMHLGFSEGDEVKFEKEIQKVLSL